MKKLLAVAFLLSLCCAVSAQVPNGGNPMVPNGGASGSGSGSVTSVATACGVSGGPITTTGTISGGAPDNPQSGATYTIQTTDCGAVIRATTAGAQVLTVPASTGFPTNFYTTYKCEASGGCSTSGTVDGSASVLTIALGNSVDLYVDGSGAWHKLPGNAAGGGAPGGSSGQIQTNNGAGGFNGGNLSGDCATNNSLSVLCQQGRLPYISGNYIIPYFMGGGLRMTGIAGAPNVIRCFTAYVKGALHIDQLGGRVNTVVAGGNFAVAVYAVNAATGKPTGTPLASSGSLSTTSAAAVTGTITSTALGSAAQSFTPLGFCFNNDTTAGSGASLMAGINADATFLAADVGTTTLANALGTAGTAPISYWSTTATFGTFGDLTSVTWIDGNGSIDVPMPIMHVSSVP